MGYAIVIEEAGQTREVLFEGNELSIGRGPDNTIVIADPRSSRHHCRLVRTPQGVLLEDLQSRNGTLLGGAPVEKALIKEGAQFSIGGTLFSLRSRDGALEEARTPEALPAPAPAVQPDPASVAPTLAVQRAPARPVKSRGAQSAEKKLVPAASAAPGLVLERMEGGRVLERIPVLRCPFVLGRGKDCDFTLVDKRSSNHHARILELDGRYYVEDMQSTNGTIVSNRVVTRALLVPGAMLLVGDSSFRVVVSGEAARPLPAEAGAPPEGVIAFDAERFLAQERSEHPLVVVALVLILLVVGYFAVDVTRRLVRYEDPDPVSANNLVTMNWSFEDLPSRRQPVATDAVGRSVVGWTVFPDDEGDASVSAVHSQPPGSKALQVVSRGDLCRVTPASLISVTSGTRYQVDGFVVNDGAFAAGILVEWLVSSSKGDVVVGRSFTDTARQRGEAMDASAVFTPPSVATTARLCLLVLGAGGRAAFDRVSFSALPEEAPDPEVDAARQECRMTVGKAPDALTLAMSSAGVFAVERKGRGVWTELWGGLAKAVDPNGFGTRLAAIRRGEGEACSFTGEIGNPEQGAWYTLEARAAISRSELQLGWRLAAGEGAAPQPLVLYFEPRDVTVAIEASAGGNKVTLTDVGAENLVLVDELLAGSREERVAIRFAQPVQLSRVEHPFDSQRRLWAAQGGPEGIELTLGIESGHESSLAEKMLLQADEAFGAGRVAAALSDLELVKKTFPEDSTYAQRATERAEAWKLAAAAQLAELRQELAAFRQTPTPVIGEIVNTRVAAFCLRWQGTAEGREAESILLEAQKARSEQLTRGLESELRTAVESGRKHVAASEPWLATLYFNWVATQDKDGPLGREATSALRLIEARRQGERRKGTE